MQHTIFMTDLDQFRLRALARSLLAQRGGDRAPGEDLQDRLDEAAVVPADTIPADVVTMNSTIACQGGPLGERERTLTLVYPDRADSAAGRISVLSPLGRALLGARAGTDVEIETPAEGLRTVHVRRIDYQPEAAGDWLL